MNTPAYASASLYVGDLQPDVTEAQLFEIFKQLGPVASIRVCRDAVTRRSLGYAYVNYHSVGDAERAIDLMNYKEIKGVPCRIMWSQRDPSLRKSNVGNIFIKNLDKSIDNKALYDTFATFGNILSCKVAMDENNNSKGYGFVHYDSAEAAELAIAKVNGKLLNGKKCFVGAFIPKKDRNDNEAGAKWTNVYVKHLDKSIDEEKLKEIFGQYGKVTSLLVVKDEKGESKGFAFVNYETNQEAQQAVAALNEKELEGYPGKQLYVGRAQKKSERERELKEMFMKLQRERMSKYQGVNLYVKNLDEAIDDEKLRQEFSHCGTITSAKVMCDEKGVSKGFGFVCFSTPEEATKAVTEMNGKMIISKPIFVALAQRKEQRRQQLEQQYQRAASMRIAQAMGPGPIYPHQGGQAVFYPPGAQRPSFVYPQQMNLMARPRFPGQPQARVPPVPGYQGVPGFPVMAPQPGRGQQSSKNPRNPKAIPPGRVAPSMPGYPGIKYNPNVRNQQVPFQPQPTQEIVNTPEDRKGLLGEELYPLIQAKLKARNQDNLTGKITGMLLESMDHPDLMNLIESSDALEKKVTEALEVLEAHAIQNKKSEDVN